MAMHRKAGRFLAKLPAFRACAAVLSLLAALGTASCGGARPPLFINLGHHTPPGSIPALSLAGRAASGCANTRPSQRETSGFEVAEPTYFDSMGNLTVDAVTTEGVGHPIVHYSRCARYSVEIVVVSDTRPASFSHQLEILRTAGLFESLIPRPSGRITLWTIAAYLRISKRERFVYGREFDVSERETLSVRLEPTQGDARLMLVYRLGL